MLKHLALIFLGGGLGSLARFFFARWFNPYFLKFPFGIFLANVCSSFIVGVVISHPYFRSYENGAWKFFLITGICGGFSTFSGFSSDTMLMLKAGNYEAALLNIGLNIVVCLLAVWGGMRITQMFY